MSRNFSAKLKIVLIGFFIFSGLFLLKAEAQACEITNINYRQNAIQDPWVDPDNNNETNFEEGFIIDNAPPYFYFDIQTTNCTINDGNPDLTFKIWEEDDHLKQIPFAGTILTWPPVPLAAVDDMAYTGSIDVSDNNFTLVFKAGEFFCESTAPFNCEYYLETTDDVNIDRGWDAPIQGMNDGSLLKYDCDGLCNDLQWVFLDQIAHGQNHPNDTTNTANTTITGGGIQSDDYLAPLPGLEGQPSGLKGFLQGLFNVLIIIAGIGAILMIVIGAITYVSADALSGKQNGRDMMLNAVLGLILALGAWVIINTINPDLAESLNITIPKVTIDGETPEWQGGSAPSGTNICPGRTLNGNIVTQGGFWPDDSAQYQALGAAGISVASSSGSNCAGPNGAGTPGCTSVYYEGAGAVTINKMIQLKQNCPNCEVVVTGGSECWLHKTHGPTEAIIDLRATPSLNQYLNSFWGGGSAGTSFPTDRKILVPDIGLFWAEPYGSAPHWHIKDL